MELEAAQELISDAMARERGPVLWLTGAGISAESGIPTFRGKDGYWTVGSTNYRAEELATFAAFRRMPAEVWSWYLYRRGVCRGADPNPAHVALAELEQDFPERFALVTQNVDGLHLRAGNSLERTFQVHGNIDYMRPVRGGRPLPLPEGIDVVWPKGRALTRDEAALLAHEGEPTRPHVLWFDECYDEVNFRIESTQRVASEAALLVVVGSTGQTNLPLQVAKIALARSRPMIVIDPHPEGSTFAKMNEAVVGDARTLVGNAGTFVPALADAVRAAR